MGHFIHYNIVGSFWGRNGYGDHVNLDDFMAELRDYVGEGHIQECIHHGARYEDCTMFTILGNGGKSGRDIDQAYARARGYLDRFAKPGEKWANVQWAEILMYSEFSNLDKPDIVAGGGWNDWPKHRPGREEHDWSGRIG